MGDRAAWQDAFDRSPRRAARFETMSGVPLRPVYGPDEAELPGQWPYTRGPYASMYRSRLWTMRQFAGFGTAGDTNGRFKELLRSGGDGLSTAFDMPTLLGRDSDDPLAKGEVGRAGVAVDTLADMETLFSDIDLGTVSTSMTINSPAAAILAMYVGVADKTGVDRARLSGTIQNDILKEYQAQKEFVFPPRPSVRLVTDVMRFAAAELPRWHPVSISGYHIREAGSTAAQELAFTLANGFAYVEAALAAGMTVDEFAPRLSFFFNAHMDFFEEIAKFRAARRIWAHWLRDRYGASDGRSLQLRFHTQTAGVSLTAQQPEVNLVRVAHRSTGWRAGWYPEPAHRLPSTKHWPSRPSMRPAWRCAPSRSLPKRPVWSMWPTRWVDRGSSSRSPTRLESEAESIFAHIEQAGSGSMLDGTIACIEDGWFVAEIADAAYQFQSKIASGEWIQVGVNGYVEGESSPPPTLSIDPEVETLQLASLGRSETGPRRRRRPPRPGPDPYRGGRSDHQPHARPHRRRVQPGHRRRIDARARIGLRHLV